MGVRKNDLGKKIPPDIPQNNCSKKISTWKIVPREIVPPQKMFTPSAKVISPQKKPIY